MHSNCVLNPSSGALINLHNPVFSLIFNHSWAAIESWSCSAVGHWIKWCKFANSSLFSILGLWSKENHEEIWWSWSTVYFSFYFSPWIILFPWIKSCTLFVGIYQKINLIYHYFDENFLERITWNIWEAFLRSHQLMLCESSELLWEPVKPS